MTQASPARRAGRNGGSRPYRPPDTGGRYGALLLLLIVSYLLSAFNVRLVADFDFALFAAVLLLALRTAPYSRATKMLIGAAALAGSAVVDTVAHAEQGGAVGAAALWKALILLVTVAIIVRRVLARPTVTIQSIYGALSAYIIIGLMFAAFFAAVQSISGVPFFAGGKNGEPQTFQYFSFTTLTTLGYGDFTAASNGGRAIAVMEALIGQVFLATLVARLVAAFRPRRESERPATSRRPPLRSLQDGAGLTRRRKPPGRTGRAGRPASAPRRPAGSGPAP